MEDSKDNFSNNVVNFAADGDIILVVGPEKKRFRLRSLSLKVASKPFLVMFGPHWQEGRDLLNHEGPMELSLPEDNSAALEIIFTIIHHQNNKVFRAIPARRVLDVAITTDKYDFINAMKLASEALLRTKKRGADDLMFLAAAAYLFQNAQAFKKITKALILKYPAPYLNLACKEIESVLTWRVFCLLEQQRSFARLELSEIFISWINAATGMCIPKCGWTCKYTHAYLNLLKKISNFGLQTCLVFLYLKQ
ncbi:3515e734-4505-45d6-ba75-2626f65c932a [Sclerotinia trifoliorum]|uniref:3515e734-4505-45d6-ba75-2626f65c932a n=1 Tax=Sclerotinia trifoliorum TaxID=28548 RepID=A0A8H2W0P5_9HELO|nr:3515e734-4505-45d6-ba75-2626f65c932a [Sclerotinia trifoliorum]